MKAILDRNLEKFMSRKLLVWVTTTVLLTVDKIDGEQWLAIALAYIGSQGIADIATAWKTGKLLKK
jgi:hypothetical protein